MPILLRFAMERDPLTEILKALVQIDPKGMQCLPALIEAAESEDDAVAAAAAKCLSALADALSNGPGVALSRSQRVFVDSDHDPR